MVDIAKLGRAIIVGEATRAVSAVGYMTVEGYLRAGARVYISSREADACQRAEQELTQFGEVHAIPADVSREDDCRALIDAVATREDRLHILVNNAGATWGAPFAEFPAATFDKVLTLNVRAPFLLTRLARPPLEAASVADNPSRVINIGSIDGLMVPGHKNFSYSASKAGIHQLTRHLAAELAPSILVNAIAPGPFQSKMMTTTLDAIGDEIAAANPVKRIGCATDVAAAAVYLASPATDFITGTVIPLDGGLSTSIGIRL